MSNDTARLWENRLFTTGLLIFVVSWLLVLATALFGALTADSPWGGAPPLWMMVPPFVGLCIIVASIVFGEITGAWKI